VARLALTAAPVGGLLAVLAIAAIVYVAPSALTVSTAAPRISLTALYSSTEAGGAPTSLPGGYGQYVSAQRPRGGDFPERRRRRIHFWDNLTHSGTGGAYSWLLLIPILVLALGAAAVPFALRRRLRRRRPQRDFASPPPFYSTQQSSDTQTLAAPPPAVATPSAPDVADRLARLEQLHQSGAITDEEFVTQRRRILGGP
jgi:hypothetical protein